MPSDIRITDPHIIKVVEAERARRGHGTATRTAGQMISERAAQLEVQDAHPAPAASAGDTRTGANAAKVA